MKPSLPIFCNNNGRLAKEWWYDLLDWRALGGHWKSFKMRPPVISRAWFIRLCTTILLWSCIVHITSFRDLWQPQMLRSCFDQLPPLTQQNLHSVARFASSSTSLPYKSNGYLLVSCNGGLNQMRAAICDMVAISKHMNVTLVIPELDKKSFWQDPSDFGDIFNVEHFITALSGQVKIVRELPDNLATKVKQGNYVALPPRSWSDETYYTTQILPLVQQHEVVFFNKTDSRLANNGLPLDMQRLRCQVNYHALRFTPRIEELGRKLVQTLRRTGPFIVLHLRYEMDMLAFSGCTQGCTPDEAEDLTRMRYAYPWWKEKVISSDERRKAGLCPLTPEETTLVLRALGYARNTQVYIAAGEIYGSERRMAPLYEAFPNVVRKEKLLTKTELMPFMNRSSQMAALDYIVSLASDVFIPTHDGNMAKVVEGHRRYIGYRPTIRLDREKLVDLLDLYESRALNWDDFALAVRQTHEDRMGQSVVKRRVLPGRPKEEDSFYSNPEECICDEPSLSSTENPKQEIKL